MIHTPQKKSAPIAGTSSLSYPRELIFVDFEKFGPKQHRRCARQLFYVCIIVYMVFQNFLIQMIGVLLFY
jgi:hypothetical protein